MQTRSPFDAVILQHIGELYDFRVQVAVGQYPVMLFRIVRFPDDRRLVTQRTQVTVQAIFRDVQLAAGEPFDIRVPKIPLQCFSHRLRQ